VHPAACAVTRRLLTEGRSAGLELIEIDNGSLRIALLPQRGMGIWKAWLKGQEFGWRSPVQGPVHPSLVPLSDPSGLGWLEGFDELLCRCGLRNIGAPDFDTHGAVQYPLHGRIANLPAENIRIDHDATTGAVRVSGDVHETRFHFHHLRLRSTLTMRPGQAAFDVCDEVTNLSARPTSIQLMYHYNIGQPAMDGGSVIVAPIKKLVPRDAHSAQGVETWDLLESPAASVNEQVYFAELYAGADGSTQVLLKNRSNTLGTSIRYQPSQLPYFICWKNSVDGKDGFVCGIEPSTSFPNPHSFETQQGREIKLAADEVARFDLSFAFHQGAEMLNQITSETEALVANRNADIAARPTPSWCVGG
jgi:hypothetical protein